MSRFLRFCAFLFVLFFTGNVLAAGYTCPTTSYKKYTSCNAGYYMTLNGTYNGTPTVGNACTKCPTGYSCGGGTADKSQDNIVCSAGYYLPANSTACTICPAGSFCPGGSFDPTATTSDRGIYSCPAASGSYLDTYTDMQVWLKNACSTATSSNTTITASFTSWAIGAAAVTDCKVNYDVTTPCGTISKDSVPAVVVSGMTITYKYDTYTSSYTTYNSSYEKGDRYFTTLSAGYYLEDAYSDTYCGTSTNRMLYRRASICGGSTYCPGFTSMPLCNSTAGWEYGEPMGMYGCATGAPVLSNDDGVENYWQSDSSASARTDCWVPVDLNKNGGTGTINGTEGTLSGYVECHYNTACSLPSASALTQTGYKFSGGWATTASGTSCSNSVKITAAVPWGDESYFEYFACKNPTYSITLNKNNGGSSTGTSTLYTTKTVGVYLDSARTQSLTTAGTYKVTMPTWAPEYYHSESEYPVMFDARPALGYYSSSDGGTQYVDADGVITTSGLTAAKGYGANATWYARYDTMVTAPDAPANKSGYTFTGWCLDNSEDCAGGMTVAAGEGFDLNDLDGDLTAMWAPHTTIRITYNGENNADGADYIYAIEGVDGVYLDAAHTKRMTTTTNPITYPDLYTWDVSFTDSYTGTNITRSGIDADPDGVYNSAGTEMIDSRGYITTAGIAAAKAVVAYDGSEYNASWGMSWTRRPGTCVTVPDAPTRTGYTFDGWVTDQDDVFQPGDEYCSHEYSDTSLTADWTANKYTITLDNANATTNGTASIYTTYNTNVYLDSSRSKAMTTSANAITVPSRTGYTFGGYYSASGGTGTQYINASGYITSSGLSAGKGYTASKTWYVKWTPNTDTKYVVNHYTKNLGATTYTLNSTDNKTGTTATIVTLANLKKTITGFTYSEGFAGTATKGTTKPTSGAVTTATILADGTRVIDLYYTRSTYTITVAAGNGISTVAASDWTGTGTASMTKSFEYGASIALDSVVTPTRKTGYTGTTYTQTSGSGTLSGTSFTVGAGTATITVKAAGISAPVVTLTPTSTTKVYNYQATTLTASNTTSYDSGITVYYKFGNATSADGTYTYGDVGTTNTTSVAATSHRGTKYYKVQVYATDGILTSSTTTSSAASVTLNNKKITFNVNGGTLSGTSPLYVSYNNASVYTGATNTTAGTVPTATKTGYTFNGWYTATSGGSQIYNASGTLTSAAVSGYTSGSKWVATADKTLYAQWTANKYTCEPGNYLNGTTCTQCTAGYYCPGDTEFTYNGGIQGRTACPAGTSAAGSDAATDCYFTVTLNKNSGTGTCGGASSTSNGSVTCYYNTACTLPSWNSSTCNITSGTKIFKGWSESSTPTSGATSLTFTAAKTVYAYWVAPTCSVTNGTGSAASTTTNAPKCTVACNTGYKTSGTYTGTVGATSYSYTCSLETYTIAYTLNGGTNYSNAPTSYNVTTSTITLGTPTRSNSTFGGWYTESGFTNKVTQIAKGSTGNKTFYAKWTCNTGYTANSGNTACVANTITVAYNGNDNTGGSAPTSPTSCTYAGTCNAPSNTYIKTGKEFTGWNTKADGTGTSYAAGASISKAVSSGTLTLYAQWKDCTAGKYCPSDKVGAQACPAGTSAAGSDAATDCYFTVTLNKNSGTGTCGGASSTSNGSVTCYYNTACTLPSWNSSTCNITNGTGSAAKVFRGWGTSASATSWVSSVKLTAAATYYAGWTAPTCSATNGTATLSGVSGNAPVCTISCSSGYSQNGGTNTTASFDVTGAAGATSASGTCKARTFTVSFNVNGGSGGQSANVTATYGSAMPTISTTKPTKAGCKFNGWYDATSGGTQYYTAAGASARTWNKTANTTLYAQWSCMSVTGPSNQSKVYDGAALTCNGGISVSAPSGASVTYATSSTGTYGAAPTITNVADSKTIYYKITATDYTDKTGSFTCSVTEATMTVSASDKTLTYNGTTTSNGTAQSCANVTVSVPSSGATVKYNTDGSSTYSTTVPTLTNQGSTTVYYQVTASNYTTKTGSYKCTMNPKAMTVSAGNKTKVYDGSALTCSVSVSVPSSGATIKYGTSSGSYTLTSAPTQTNVGSQTVYYQVTGSNFTTKTGSFTCSVTQADGSTTIKDGSTDVTNKSGSTAYPGTKSLTITCAGGATSGITATSGTTSVATTSVSGTSVTLTPKATGSSEITVNCPTTTNYKASSATYDWTVTNGTISVSKSDKSKTYDGSALTCDGLTVNSPSGTTIEYSTDGGSTWSTTVPSRTDAGTTTVNYRVSKTYYTTVTGSFSCKVNKAANPISVSSCGGEIAYPNSDTFTVSGAQGTLSVSSSATGVATVSISGTTGTVKSVKPGTATITVSAAGNDNYNAGSKTCSYEVVKGTNPISLSATSGSTTYPSTKSITVSNAAGTVTASSSATGVATVSVSSDGTTVTMTPKSAGSATITVTAAGDDYYNSGSKTYALTVNRGTCTISVSPTSGTIKIPTTTSTFTVNSGSCNGALSAVSSNTGVATVALSSKTGTVTWQSAGTATITVTAAQTGQYAATTATYAVTTQKGDITATIAGNSKTYNGSALTCNGGISGLTPSDATIEYSTDNGSTWTTTAPTRTSAGTTTVKYRLSKTNYNNKEGTFSCTVNKAAGTTTIDAGASSSTAFPGTKVLNITCSEGATISSATSGTTAVATVATSGNKVTLTPVKTGSSVITVNCPATTNYNASSATHTWTVSNGTITATVTNPSKTYDGSALSCAGISNVVPSGATVTYAEKSGTTCGTYSSTVPSRTNAGTTNVCYKIEATNYTTKTGEFSCTVNKADNTLTLSATSGSMSYSSTATFTVSKNTSGGTLSVESSNENCATATISGTTVTISSKANYCTANITVTSAATTNYKTKSATYALTVNKGTITLNNRSATSAGTTVIYQTYNTNVYLDSVRSKAMTTSANAITVPSRTGYTFGGYYSASDGTGTQYINASGNITSDGLTAGKALQANGTWYAKWTANTYTIVYNANKPSAASASVSGSTASSTHTYDTAKALTSNGFSLTGWSFAGWNTQADGSGTSYSNGASVKNLSATKGATVNLYAQWTQNCIPVTLDANGGTAGSVTKIYKKADATGWYSDSACATAYTTNANLKPSRSGYTFRGFYVEPVDDISASQTTAITRYLLSDASTSTTGTNWKINAARTLYAGWAKTCVQPSNGTCKFSHGDKAVYTTTCNTGYSISGNATATPSCSIITYTIKYMDGSTEITGLTPATYNVTTATFNLPTAYKATYKFASWHTDSALSSTAETQIAKGTTGDKVYYVKWSTCPAGSVCDGDSVVTCPAGSYCAAGSSEATPCAKGSYSTGGATTCKLADKGYYVDTTGATEQIACPAGTYGSTTGLTSAACSGKCSAGRYGNATAQTAATCNGACSAGYYCPAGSTSATAYDCDTGKTTASSNNYWTSDSGAGARSSCYRNVVLNKNGMSGTLALSDSSGCKSLDTSTNTLVVYYGKECKLPTTVLSGTATGTTYTGTGTWATSANAANGFVSSITVTSEAATVTYYAGKMYTCSAGYYLKANTNGACTACASPYYCTGITNKYYSSSIQGRSACSALDSTKTDGTYSSVSPYDAATTCRFKQEQQTVPTYCETKVSNTMKYTSSGWEANTYSVTAKSGAIISGNNTTGATCSQCAAGTYSAGGTDTTCDAISAGCYGGAGSATACPNQCSAGTYRTSTGGKTQSDCSNVTAGCYGSAGATEACPAVCATNNYSDAGASACTPCDSDYANSGDTAASHAGVASCKVTCPAGQYVATANAACSDVGSGYYRSGTETISQGNKGTREACNALNAFYTASDSGRDAATDCFGTTTGGNYIATPKAGQVTCAAGGYCAGGSKVYYEKTGGRTACPAGTANPNTGSSASSACVTCAAGKYNTTEGNTSCSTCPANSYCTGGTNNTACNTVAGKLYTKSAEGSDAATDCYVTLASKVYLAKPTDTATTTCTAGYYCAGGDYYYSSTATNQGRSSCTGATYSGAGAASCSNCPSGYTANTSSNKTANTQCQISVDGGHYIAEAGQNSTNWGTCVAGYANPAHTVNYGTTSSCAACTGATYAENAGQASCTACPTATNTSAQGVVSSYSYWISGGIHTSRSNCSAYFKTETLEHGTMNVYCYVDANADTYGVDGSSKLGCYVRKTGLTCDDGYYNAKFSTLGSSETQYNSGKTIALARASACTAVGEDYWSPADDWTRTACATGLTTCGSGLCANEADDCGRKLHAGDKVIHLRSAERTSPSLRVKVGDTMFYGNLVSPVDGTLKVKNGTSTYSVANDNQ